MYQGQLSEEPQHKLDTSYQFYFSHLVLTGYVVFEGALKSQEWL